MNILLSGYGAMGQQVAQVAADRGHRVVGIYSHLPIDAAPFPVYHDIAAMPTQEIDVIIDFSHPNNVSVLLQGAAQHMRPIVVATTGERERLLQAMTDASTVVPLFFSANMSYGVHILNEILRFVAPLLADYDVEIIEKHHRKKVDAPSGTAVQLLETIQAQLPQHYPVYDRSQVSHERNSREIGMSVVRGGTIVGEHDVLFAGGDEEITISHRAQSKRIFAEGAVRAAEKLIHCSAGFYQFSDLMS